MERAREGRQLYFRIDGHWNVEGHQLAARTIYDYLAKSRLLQRVEHIAGGKS